MTNTPKTVPVYKMLIAFHQQLKHFLAQGYGEIPHFVNQAQNIERQIAARNNFYVDEGNLLCLVAATDLIPDGLKRLADEANLSKLLGHNEIKVDISSAQNANGYEVTQLVMVALDVNTEGLSNTPIELARQMLAKTERQGLNHEFGLALARLHPERMSDRMLVLLNSQVRRNPTGPPLTCAIGRNYKSDAHVHLAGLAPESEMLTHGLANYGYPSCREVLTPNPKFQAPDEPEED